VPGAVPGARAGCRVPGGRAGVRVPGAVLGAGAPVLRGGRTDVRPGYLRADGVSIVSMRLPARM